MTSELVPSVFRRVFEHAPIGLEIGDSAGRIVQVNPALAAMVDHSTEQLVGSEISALTHPDDREASANAFEQLLSGQLEHLRREAGPSFRRHGVPDTCDREPSTRSGRHAGGRPRPGPHG